MSKPSPSCVKCKATSSLMWHKAPNGNLICLECQAAEKKANSNSSSPQSTRSTTSVLSDTQPSQHDKNSVSQSPGPTTRRSTRSRERANKAKQQSTPQGSPSSMALTTTSLNPSANTPTNFLSSASNSNGNKDTVKTEKASAAKDKDVPQPVVQTGLKDHHINQWQRGRRSLSLKLFQPIKSPVAQSAVVTGDSINHNGTIYEVGDIVSVLDEDGGVYYALVRGFLQDHHAEKYAVITWLLPTYPNPTHFDPTRFILGPEEDSPMSLDVVEFVCHSPQSKNFQASYFHNVELASLWDSTHQS